MRSRPYKTGNSRTSPFKASFQCSLHANTPQAHNLLATALVRDCGLAAVTVIERLMNNLLIALAKQRFTHGVGFFERTHQLRLGHQALCKQIVEYGRNVVEVVRTQSPVKAGGSPRQACSQRFARWRLNPLPNAIGNA